jgi:hypothetical protein
VSISHRPDGSRDPAEAHLYHKESLMRLRLAVLASLASALVAVIVPAVATAAPRHNNGLTIHATPDPIIAGESVLIYGQLNGGSVAGQRIVLYHHVNGSHRPFFSRISSTRTDEHGFYEFIRPDGLVETNREWFVREPSVHAVHSRTVRERVSALVSLSADKTSTDTRQPITFTGHVDPNHAFEAVALQQQVGGADHWKTLKRGRLNPGSDYSITYRFRFPGARDVRVLFRGDHRNIRSASDPLTVTIQQAQIPDFTINSSSPIIQFGQSATITGTLYTKGSNAREPNTPVTLCSRDVSAPQFTCDTAGMTDAGGNYSFNVTPVHNEAYLVQTTLAPHRHTAVLFEGVRDVVTLTGQSPDAAVGQPYTFSGNATPDKAGDTVYLQRLGADGDWHTVGVSTVNAGSTFQFTRTFGYPGTKTLRARIPGDPENIGGASAPVTVNVSLPPLATLPQGS